MEKLTLNMKTLVILPTYNEVHSIKEMVNQLLSLREGLHVLIVDDNSSDGTKEIIQDLRREYLDRVFLIERQAKFGLGSAYVRGFRFAIEHNYDYIFEMDADLSHDPQEIPHFLDAIRGADVVIGSRYLDGIRIVDWPLKRIMLSYAANIYARKMTGLRLTDCTSGFKCFSRKALEILPLDLIVSTGYAFQIEVNFLCQRMGLLVKEKPIVFTERKFGSSKMSKQIIFEAFLLGIRLFLKRMLSRK